MAFPVNNSSSGASLTATEEFFLVKGGRYVVTAGLASGTIGTATIQYLDASGAWVDYTNSDGTLPYQGIINVPQSGYVRWEISGGVSPVVDVDFAQQRTADLTGDPTDVGGVDGEGGGITNPTAFKTELGLENVDNTSDLNKPISTATQAALDGKINVPWEIPDCLACWDMFDVVTASSKVTQYNDRTGNGKHATQSNASLQHAVTETANQPVGGAGAGYTITGGLAVNFQAMTVIGIFRTFIGSQAFGGQSGMFFRVAGTSPGIYWGEYNNFEYGRGGGDYVVPLCLPPNGAPGFYAATYGTTESVYYNNGGRYIDSADTAGTGTLSYIWGTETSGNSGLPTPVIATLVFSRKLTRFEVAQIARYYGCDVPSQATHLMVTGSSTPAAYLASNYQAGVIAKLASKMGWQISAGGVNGTSMATTAAIAQAAMIPTPGHVNVWLVFMTSNDIASATGATATYETNLSQHMTRLRAADPTGLLVLVDMPPRKGSLSGGQTEAGYETDRQTLNAYAVTNKATLCDILISFNDSTTIGQQSDVDNTTYYNADKIHLTDLGHTELANLIAKGVRQYA